MTRRQALARVAAQAVGGQRLWPAPRNQLVNTLEYEQQARRVIPPALASLIADTADRNGAVSADSASVRSHHAPAADAGAGAVLLGRATRWALGVCSR